MVLRNRGGVWYWRLWHRGREHSGSTGLEATKRNVSAARQMR